MIGVLGGTFDPIHYGHLRPAQEVCRLVGLRQLHLVPSATPPHRPAPIATASQRYEMVKLATDEFPGFVADDREIRRGGVSYTVDTILEMRQAFGNQPLCFLLGADAFAGLASWSRWQEIVELAHLVVVQRPGSTQSMPAWAIPRVRKPNELGGAVAGAVLPVAVTPRDISATALRAAIARGEKPAADVLPPAVWNYIDRHNVYRSHIH